MRHLIWIDLEMTGLDVEKEVVIEVAAVVTDLQWRKIDSYHSVVKQPREYLDRMDEWNKKHHTASGLIYQVPTGKDANLVEEELVHFVKKYFPEERAVLAGNSIAQDRLFIDRYFKQFSSMLHYRMLDVTSWKIVMKEIYGVSVIKKETHRALDDINESIEELRTYLSYIQVPRPTL